MTRVAIIGAGISGLAVAHLLKNDVEVTLFEKSRGVGGRISTRRNGDLAFDHGAQYFTARTAAFKDFIQPLRNKGFIARWDARYAKIDGTNVVARKNWGADHPRYVGVPSMNQICKHLAKDLDVKKNTKIIAINGQDKWQLTDTEGKLYPDFDWVVSTIPAPQAHEIVPACFRYHRNMSAIKMEPCFALMLGLDDMIALDFEAAHITNSDLSWMAINSSKPGRGEAKTLVIHSSKEYAKSAINSSSAEVMQHLLSEASRVMGVDLNGAEHKAIQRWLYASNENEEPTATVFLDHEHKLAVCGDWVLGGRIESAFNSAHDLVVKLKGECL